MTPSPESNPLHSGEGSHCYGTQVYNYDYKGCSAFLLVQMDHGSHSRAKLKKVRYTILFFPGPEYYEIQVWGGSGFFKLHLGEGQVFFNLQKKKCKLGRVMIFYMVS
jgi:hypothetical protein